MMTSVEDIGRAADAAASHSHLHFFDGSLDRALQANHTPPQMSKHENALSTEYRPPNPSVEFPASPAPPARSRRRPISMVDIQSRYFGTLPPSEPARGPQPAALPQFSFNPGASIPTDQKTMTALNPPITPNSSKPMLTPSRLAGHGHRRGGSEFVGGNIREGNSIAVMSTSPTKSENGFASPTLQPSLPRRGHRRGVSGAISTNDLPLLYPQPDFKLIKGSSAPNSPTSSNSRVNGLVPVDDCSCSLPESVNLVLPSQSLEDTVESINIDHSISVSNSLFMTEFISMQTKPGRARVGFSDTLEFIPRPLSLVSNDTSSTITARPSHSVSGSISSIVSAASLGDRDNSALLTRSPTREISEARPSTAGAILERTPTTDFTSTTVGNTSPRRRNSTPTLLDVVASDSANDANPSPTKTSKRWSIFGLDPFMGSTHTSKQRSFSSSSSDSVNKSAAGGFSSDQGFDSDGEAATDDANDSWRDQKKTSKAKRVKGWAGAILPLRSNKMRSKILAVRPPTPPASVTLVEDEEDEADGVEVELGANKGQVLTPTLLVTESQPVEEEFSSNHRRIDEDGAYPMIDLDAALGPFNTPIPDDPEWDAAQRAAGFVGKRRLHSAQGMKGFSGPGMHYHRRAESAPDLPPFDLGCVGIHRFGSNSTMADVFEEDEEEILPEQHILAMNVHDEGDSIDVAGEVTPPAKRKLTARASNEIVVRKMSSRSGSCGPSSAATGSDGVSPVQAVHTEYFKTSLHEEINTGESPSIIFCNASLFSGLATDQISSASSSPRLPPNRRDLSPLDIHQPLSQNNTMAVPLSPAYSMSNKSSYTSPLSPMSIDGQRISTTTSSGADENSFHSLLMGEPGPEVRISADYDIPSLTSSISTTTRESAFVPTARMSQPNFREQRPVSVSSAAFGGRRASLVSLGRLISSSHGERSKLSMGITLDTENEAKKSRLGYSKTKRLGRLMQFWKSSKNSSPQ